MIDCPTDPPTAIPATLRPKGPPARSRFRWWLLLLLCAPLTANDLPPVFEPGLRILFQGDSITDGNRGRSPDPNHVLGHGYAFLIAAQQGAAFPEANLVFLNRGVSGNRVGDLAQRWQAEAIDLKPDVVSVLIGVNDILMAIDGGQPWSAAAYETTYRSLLDQARTANPAVRFILGEPFILPGHHTSARWDQWQLRTAELRQAVQRLGERYHAPVVHFQALFDAAAKRPVPADYWIWDGIHPTYSGHQLMADAWIKAYREAYPAR